MMENISKNNRRIQIIVGITVVIIIFILVSEFEFLMDLFFTEKTWLILISLLIGTVCAFRCFNGRYRYFMSSVLVTLIIIELIFWGSCIFLLAQFGF